MADEGIAQRVRELLASYSGASQATLGGDSTPRDTEGWDSLANQNLMAAIESEFGPTIATRDVMKLRSLGDITAYVEANTVARRTR